MHYLLHLMLPSIVALLVQANMSQMDWSASWLKGLIDDLMVAYFVCAAPHWIWAVASGIFAASKATVVGGFIGLHLLLCAIWLMIAQSTESHSSNGWFVYWLGAPTITAVGALIGRQIGQRRSTLTKQQH